MVYGPFYENCGAEFLRVDSSAAAATEKSAYEFGKGVIATDIRMMYLRDSLNGIENEGVKAGALFLENLFFSLYGLREEMRRLALCVILESSGAERAIQGALDFKSDLDSYLQATGADEGLSCAFAVHLANHHCMEIKSRETASPQGRDVLGRRLQIVDAVAARSSTVAGILIDAYGNDIAGTTELVRGSIDVVNRVIHGRGITEVSLTAGVMHFCCYVCDRHSRTAWGMLREIATEHLRLELPVAE